MNKILTIFLNFLLLNTVHAEPQVPSDEQIIKSNIPSIFFTLKNNSTDELLIPTDIQFKFVNETFNHKDGTRYLVVVYNSGTDVSQDDQLADLRVIKIDKKGFVSITPKITYKFSDYPLDIAAEISTKDLDGDGINEVFVTNKDWKNGDREAFVFKWVNDSLLDLTPIITVENMHFSSSALINIGFSDFIINGKRTIYSNIPNIIANEFNGTLIRTYQLTNNSIEEIGTFQYLTIVEKLDKKPVEKVEMAELKSEGEHQLTVTNISDQKTPVRSEVIINTNVVIKASDFCASPPPKVYKSEIGEESDANEDHLKGCKTKSEVSVDLTLMKVNTIKVKLFGKKGSRIQVTLKKK